MRTLTDKEINFVSGGFEVTLSGADSIIIGIIIANSLLMLNSSPYIACGFLAAATGVFLLIGFNN